MDWLVWILLPLVGALGGFLAGMLGVGGGIIFIPLLTWLFAREGVADAEIVKYTLANSIFLVFVSGITGILRQKRKGTLDWNRMLVIGIPGAFVALIWSLIVSHGFPDFSDLGNWMSQQGNWYRKSDFQIVFLGFLIISISNMLFGKKETGEEEPENAGKQQNMLQLFVAVLAGTVVSLSGLGGGVIMVPLFRIFLKMPMKKATALSLSIIPFLSIAPLASYIFSTPQNAVHFPHSGYLVWNYALPIAAAVAIFANLGMRTAKKMPVKMLRMIFASISGIIFIKTLYEIYTSH